MTTTNVITVLETQVRTMAEVITRVEVIYRGKTDMNLAVVHPDGRGGELRQILGSRRTSGFGEPRQFGSMFAIRNFLRENLPGVTQVVVLFNDDESQDQG